MKRFLRQIKHNIPWPLLAGGLAVLVVGLLLKEHIAVLICGCVLAAAIVYCIVRGCILDMKFPQNYKDRMARDCPWLEDLEAQIEKECES